MIKRCTNREAPLSRFMIEQEKLIIKLPRRGRPEMRPETSSWDRTDQEQENKSGGRIMVGPERIILNGSSSVRNAIETVKLGS